MYEYTISISTGKALLHIKTEVVIKMFCKKVVLTISGESQEVTCSFSIILHKSF